MLMRITGKRGSHNGREITGLLDYNVDNNSVLFTVFYRIEGYNTKTFCWITEINKNYNVDIIYATDIVRQIKAILGIDELKTFQELFKQLKDNLF